MDTNTVNPTPTSNPTSNLAPTKRPRIKDALASGICKGTDSMVSIVDGVAVRIKLHNLSVATELIDDFGIEKITAGQQLISSISKL